MATIDRFKDMLKQGHLPKEQGGQALTAQTKYDFLAAVHTMDQLQALEAAFDKRAQKRATLQEKLLATSRATLQKLLEDEEGLASLRDLDAAIKVLTACRTELLTIETEQRTEKALAKFIADGITAK